MGYVGGRVVGVVGGVKSKKCDLPPLESVLLSKGGNSITKLSKLVYWGGLHRG